MSEAVREAGGTAAGLGGGEWLDAVGKKAEPKGLRSLVTELAVEAMPISDEATPRYISGCSRVCRRCGSAGRSRN